MVCNGELVATAQEGENVMTKSETSKPPLLKGSPRSGSLNRIEKLAIEIEEIALGVSQERSLKRNC